MPDLGNSRDYFCAATEWRDLRYTRARVLAFCFSFVCLLTQFPPAVAEKLQIELVPQWNGRPLGCGKEIPRAKIHGFSISRLEGLVSELALQRMDGSWLNSDDWFFFFSL